MESVGRYRLAERLGTGAFATVWHGYDDELDVPVAVKVLADHWAHDHDVRARFIAEARLLRRVRDQRVVRVHDIGELPDSRPYFVMDFADGGTLAALVTGPDRPTAGEALRLGAETARAVAALHDHGFAHRDIKPQNLLLTSDGGHHASARRSVVVADLGMAKSLSEASGFTVTAGTPAYMAPEQALGLGFDQRADVYAVAAVTYALLAGRPPYEGGGLTEIAERSRSSTPPLLAIDVRGWVDDELGAALAYDPEARPRTALELAGRLDHLADTVDPAEALTMPMPVVRVAREPSRPAPPTPEPAPPTPEPPTPATVQWQAPPPVRPRGTPAAVVVGGAVLLAAATTWLTWFILTVTLSR